MTDYRKILVLRSKKCSQREMERNKVAFTLLFTYHKRSFAKVNFPLL